MQPFVLDASITMEWCCEDEATPYTEELLNWCAAETPAYSASIWLLEIINTLLIAQRKGRITGERGDQFLERLERFSIHTDIKMEQYTLHEIRRLAQSYRLTSYDAAYLELALRMQLPLATLDHDLRKAASAAGVQRVEI